MIRPAPLPPTTEIPFGELDMWRASIAEVAQTLVMRASMLTDYAALRDDFGLTRTLRLMTVEMRLALSLCADLDEQKLRERERQASSSPTQCQNEQQEALR